MDFKTILDSFTGAYIHSWMISPVMLWLLFEYWIVILIIFLFKKFPKSSFVIFFDFIFEKVYDFFEDLLWVEEKDWIKMYVTILFFIIVISNLFWLFLDILLPAFWINEAGHPLLAHYIEVPTVTKEFNIAMAIVWVIIVLSEQFKSLWFKHFLYEYFPIFWKDYVPYTRWKLPKFIDIPLFIFVKIFDIIISMFLWILDIIWLVAKIISLSFRLFWNIFSWWILLWMLIAAVTWLSMSLANIQFPIIAPIIIYLQWLLVAMIQAFVFPLLIAIFIKVAKLH
jgi:F0F1-type ATP synthase membrane subunit a